MNMTDAQIVRSIRESKGLSRKELSEKISVPEQTIANYELGTRTPSFEYMRKLGETFQVNIDYLFYGKGEMFYTPSATGEIISSTNGDNLKDEYIRVPLLDEVRAAAGDGIIAADESSSRVLVFRKDWIKRNNITSNTLSAIHVVGDSMYPTLITGDALLVDHSQTHPRMDKIYVVRAGEGVVVKRIGEIKDSKVELVSDNTAIRPFTIDLSNDSAIIGRVVWYGRTI